MRRAGPARGPVPTSPAGLSSTHTHGHCYGLRLLWASLALVLAQPATAYLSETFSCDAGARYSLSWGQVYQLDRDAMPQGCTCATDQSDGECTKFDCDCICDLTAGACDINCCCDSECSDDQIDRFKELDACLDEGPADSVIERCWSTSELESVNPRYPLTTRGTAEETTSELLCVQHDNSDVKGDYHSDPGYPSDTIFDESAGEKDYAYTDYVEDGTITSASESQFDGGVVIPAGFASESGVVAAYGGYMPVPVAGPGGACVENSYATFSEPVRDNTCLRFITSLASSCGAVLNATRFSSELLLGADPKSAPATTGGTSDYVSVAVTGVTYLDPDTGDKFSWDGGANYSAYYADNTCFNAVTKVCWTISFNEDGEITAAAAELTVTDITADNSTDDLTVVQQEFDLEFDSAVQTDAIDAQSSGNVVNRTRSGNPGYISGLPLLAGTLTFLDSDSAMSARIPGLQVLGSSTHGACTHNFAQQTVNFGEDLVSGCVLSLNRSALEEMCDLSGPHMELSSFMSTKLGSDHYTPIYLNISDTHVGIFGNADPLDPSQWLEIGVEASSSTSTWYPAKGACSSMITSLNYRFLVSYVGTTSNPQAKIIAARVEYGRELVAFTPESGEDLRVPMTTTVSFIRYLEASSQSYAPPPPPLLFSLPYDTFYPFHTNAARGRQALPWALTLLLLATSSVHLVLGR